jgi:glucosamine-6-phosphate deaminase
MNYHIYKDADTIGKIVAGIFIAQVQMKPNSVLGFATGSTPIPTYNYMIKGYKDRIVCYGGIRAFNLDEYCGLERTHEQSYHYFMMDNLFNHINVPLNGRIFVPEGVADDFDEECKHYESLIYAAGGIDLQILGIGNNGHIGFNEPSDSFSTTTHKVKLTESTIEANKRFFNSADDVPKYAITMGIGTIMRAKSIVLIATGKGKAEAIKAMIKDEPHPSCPASVLQFHPSVTVFLNEQAASLL